jgi:hypothetical protein
MKYLYLYKGFENLCRGINIYGLKEYFSRISRIQDFDKVFHFIKFQTEWY